MLAKAVVDLDVALVVAHCIAVGADVVVLDAERVGSGLVGEWIKLGMSEEILYNRIGDGYLIVGVGYLTDAGHIVSELRWQRGEVASTKGRRNDGCGLGAALVIAGSLIVNEEEELIALDGTAEGTAEDSLGEGLARIAGELDG